MNHAILKYLKEYSFKTSDINKLLVSAYVKVNNIGTIQNNYINQLIIKEDDYEENNCLKEFLSHLTDEVFDIESLLELFEFVISPADKEVNGAVFTPIYIRNFIVQSSITKQINLNNNLNEIKFGDIACGCGGFFITITKYLKEKTSKSYFAIFSENIFGVDIQNYSVERTKILLSLYAITNGEDVLDFNFNLYQGNSLNFDWSLVQQIRENNGFDIIVGNPPYVGASKIDEETKILLKNWTVSSSGKSDLYIPFFEIGMKNLKVNGTLGYITVNTFYKSLNGRSVRNYFSENCFDFQIIDFGGEQLFKKRSTYTCICIITKIYSEKIKYVKSKSKDINSLKELDYLKIPYSNLNNFEGWFLISEKINEIIVSIEKTGKPLGSKFEIRNGFATLKNNVYVFKPSREDENYYYLLKDKSEYKIEKKICRDAIKPNTLKSAEEIEHHTEKLIFPYLIENLDINLFKEKKQSLKIIKEKTFKINFPFAYQYLCTQKTILSERDKGNRQYEEWYAYGRNQALLMSGYKLLLPYITSEPCFVFTENQDLLFYNGYAIFSNSAEDLYVLQKILMSKIFWFYIENTSKPYAGNYFSVAKNYIKNFGIIELNDEDKKTLMGINDSAKIDKFLLKKYNISLK